jgi:hypothetical protein
MEVIHSVFEQYDELSKNKIDDLTEGFKNSLKRKVSG